MSPAAVVLIVIGVVLLVVAYFVWCLCRAAAMDRDEEHFDG